MKIKTLSIGAILCSLLSSCHKDNLFNNSTIISGYAYILDTTVSKTPIPFKNQTIYLNKGMDTLNYVFQTETDTTGYFSIPYLTKNTYTLFGHYYNTIKYYSGSIPVKLNSDTAHKSVFLYLSPVTPTNEDILFFEDSAGGSLSNLPFNIYTSSVLASLPSTDSASKYAYLNGVSDSTGHYKLFNAGYNESYFIVAYLKLGKTLTAFDSIYISPTSAKSFTVTLSYAAKR